MNNAVFGKTMENVRLYTTVKLCTDAKKFTNKIVPNTRFLESIAIHENPVFCKIRNKQVLPSKPIFTGGPILGIRKPHMHKFHYDFINKKYGDNDSFFNGDTDSPMYEIRIEDLYNDLLNDKNLSEHFDLPVFPPSHPLHPLQNNNKKGKTGFFKD